MEGMENMEAGFYIFLAIAGMAFWMLIFLFGIALPYWVTLGSIDMLKKFTGGKPSEEQPTEVTAE